MELRLACPSDAPALLAIYRQYGDTPITFEYPLPSEAEFAARMAEICAVYPCLLALEDGSAAGYAYAHPFKERAAYQWGAELSVYLDRASTARGLGRRLYGALIELLRLQGVRTVYGCVTLPNTPSEHLHEAMGFRRAGVFRNAGYRLGAWRDVAWYEKEIAPYDAPTPLRTIREAEPAQMEAILRGAGLSDNSGYSIPAGE